MANRDKKQDLMVKIVCVVLAFGLWLYVTNTENINKTYTLRNIPVEVLNEDTLIKNLALTLVPDQELYVDLTIEGPTTAVYSVKASDFRVVLDLSNYILVEGKQEVTTTVKEYPDSISIKSSSDLKVTIEIDEYIEKDVPIVSRISATTITGAYASEPVLSINSSKVAGAARYVNQVKYLVAEGYYTNLQEDYAVTLPLVAVDENYTQVTNLQIIEPATVNVTIPVRKSKYLTVNVKTQGSLPNGYELKSVEVSPNRIEVIGDEDLLSTLTTVDTAPVDLSSIPENGEVYVSLVVPDQISVVGGEATVLVKVNTNKIVEKTFDIPLTISNLSEDMTANLSETKVTVVVSASEENIESITEDSLQALVNAEDLTEGEHDVQVNVTTSASGAKIVSFTPNLVRITIAKK